MNQDTSSSPRADRWGRVKRATTLDDRWRPVVEQIFSAYIRERAAERAAAGSINASKLLQQLLMHVEAARSTCEDILRSEDASAAIYEAESQAHGFGVRTDESLDELIATVRKADSVCRKTRPGPKCDAEYALIRALSSIIEVSVGRKVGRSDADVEMFVEIFELLGPGVRRGTINEALRARVASNEIAV